MWIFIISILLIVFIGYLLLRSTSDIEPSDEIVKNNSYFNKIYEDNCYFVCPKCDVKHFLRDVGCENCDKKTLGTFYWENGFHDGIPWIPFSNPQKSNERIRCKNCYHEGYLHCPKCNCSINIELLTHDVDPEDPRVN